MPTSQGLPRECEGCRPRFEGVVSGLRNLEARQVHTDYYSLLCERGIEALTKAQKSDRRGHAATMGTPAGPSLLLLMVGLLSVTGERPATLSRYLGNEAPQQGSNHPKRRDQKISAVSVSCAMREK